ncbi:hypothetical protein SCLCIDRAFT_26577 [Scleroderma citrinum Foug A]|uniref:Uncharacterized protein n=1 Tax=Scleroderma citrinum Foug A TaxID=1036808 RepID=A0A0C2ZFS8_9AGAM|nr:hypothetical protein SCLCIDRAFT_26577 [Scleroderma citrinum Foug A]
MVGIRRRGRWDVVEFGGDKGELEIQVVKDAMVDCSEVLKFELGVAGTEPFEERNFVIGEKRSLEDVCNPLMLLYEKKKTDPLHHPMDPFNESELSEELSQPDQLESDKENTPDFSLSINEEIKQITFIDDAYIPPFDSPVPTPVVSPIKTSPKKTKCGRPPKRKQSENDTLSSLPKPTVSKKKKMVSKTAIFDIEEDEVAEPPPQSITAHLHLESTVEVVSRTRGKSTSSTSTRLTQCNPFIFMVKDNFDTFIDVVA